MLRLTVLAFEESPSSGHFSRLLVFSRAEVGRMKGIPSNMFVKSSLCFAILFLMAVLHSSFVSADTEVVPIPAVSKTGGTVTTIAIPNFQTAGSSGNISPSKFQEIIYNDLEIFSDFARVSPQNFVEEADARDRAANKVDFAEWSRIRANFVLKGKYSVEGGMIIADCYLYEVAAQNSLLSLRYKDYPAGNNGYRRLAHRISDDIINKVTGNIGIASTRIAFRSQREAGNSKEIYVIDADGEMEQRLTFDHNLSAAPCWGKNMTEIYFTTYKDRNPDLCGVQIDTKREWYMSRRSGLNIGANWSPVNQRIVYTLGRDGNPEVYTVDRSGDERTLRRLTNTSAIESSPCWNPSGTQIVFVSDRTGVPQIYIMNSDGSGVRRVTTQGMYNTEPSWSPKGDRIAYSARDHGIMDIYMCNADGSRVNQLTSNAGNNEDPSWAPDGKHLVFMSNRTGRYQLYIMKDDGTNLRQITRTGANMSPAWSMAIANGPQ